MPIRRLSPQRSRTSTRVQQTPEQLQQLGAPIALYPDELVAQVLAASTPLPRQDHTTIIEPSAEKTFSP